MTKKKRNHNLKSLKNRRSYTLAEISEKLDVHVRTVQSWRKGGLEVINPESKPFLILGQDLKDFLKACARRRRHPLKTGEFFCPHCHLARKSLPDKITLKHTERKLGPTFKQVIIHGVCEVCGQGMIRFSSDRKAQKWLAECMQSQEQKAVIVGNEYCSLNTDIERGEKC